ncbi:MAG TPA: hypothetical protein VK165_03610 [Azonexus sp.]|nr:hypothetical protein [Azonexus sp.]
MPEMKFCYCCRVHHPLDPMRLDWLQASFKSGRILVSATKTRRFRDLGFRELRNGRIDGKHLMLRRF